MKRHSVLALVALLAMSIDAEGASYTNAGYLNAGYLNAGYLNAGYLNAGYLNAGYLNAGTSGGYSLGAMTTVQGQPISSVTLSATTLIGYAWVYEYFYGYHFWGVGWGWDWNYRQISGQGFVGAQIQATVTNPDTNATVNTVTLRIASITQQPFPDTDVNLYAIEMWTGVTGTDGIVVWSWKPLCGTEGGVPVKSLPLQGAWNYQQGAFYGGAKISSDANQITFACMNGALGKCGAGKTTPNALGYKPWRTRDEWVYNDASYTWYRVSGLGIADHQACSRMITADYCGDGVPHTISGNPIDAFDRLPDPVNLRSWSEPQFEATWRPDGARILECERMDEFPFGGSCPTYHYGSGWFVMTKTHAIYWLCYAYGQGATPGRNELATWNDNDDGWDPTISYDPY
jgi:hypothetical protein